MSRRTFPRAAAGLVAAALGTASTASAQAPNPWRGETAARPTATPSRQIVVGFGYNTLGGLTGTAQYRTVTGAPIAPAPGAATAVRPVCVDLEVVSGACPAPTQYTAQGLTTPTAPEITYQMSEPATPVTLKALVAVEPARQSLPVPRYLTRYPTYFASQPSFPMPRELTRMADTEVSAPTPLKAVRGSAPAAQPAGYVTPAGYAAPMTVSPLRYMPPPAPLPVPLPAPRPIPPAVQDVLVPLQVEGTFPEKGVRPVWTPSSNAVPHGRLQSLESSLPTATRAAQAQP